jgi:hypothetical protein
MNNQMKFGGLGAPLPSPKPITGATNQAKEATEENINIPGSSTPNVQRKFNPNKIEGSVTYCDEKS